MRDPAPLTSPPAYLDHAAARRIVVGVLLTMLLAALDQVMVATALPTIAAALGDVDNMSWVVTANLLCATAATPLYGKLSDIHGRRTMMLIAIGIYAVGSLACALAPTMLALILGRALQGLGGGGLDAAGADHHRRRRLAARSSALPVLHLLDLHRVDGGRAAHGRLHRRAPALVVDFLDQPAALRAGISLHPQRAAAAAAPRPSAQARRAGCDPDGRRSDRADARAHLGRAALRLGVAADSRAVCRVRRDVDPVRLARDDGGGAVHPARGAARRRRARGHDRRLLRSRRDHCADHLPAALCPAGAWPVRERVRPFRSSRCKAPPR